MISIARRLRPFVHRPGVWCMIPGSSWKARVFPTRIDLESLDGQEESISLDLDIKGPVKGFTVELDLERFCVRVFGTGQEGHFRYQILLEEGAIELERLSMGVHKAQCWDDVIRRADPKEWFPFVFQLGQMAPASDGGSFELLKKCEEAALAKDKLGVQELCQLWWKTAFSGMLVPRAWDDDFQGILSQEPIDVSPLPQLSGGSRWIRSLFFREEDGKWEILPCLLPMFPAGRMTGIKTSQGDRVAIEWSKHQLQKMWVRGTRVGTRCLKLPKGIRSCRVRRSMRDRGQVVQLVDQGITIDSAEIFLDRFFS